MLDITAANSVNLQKPAKAKASTWRTRKEAINAAVAEIGPHARHEFEFITERCDGRWLWKATDEVKPPTGAELKAMGGRKGLLSLTMAANALGGSLVSHVSGTLVDSVSPQKRITELPAGEARHSGDVQAVQEAGDAVNAAALAAHEERGRERAEAEGRAYPEPEGDGLDIPEFLKRKDSPEQRAKIAKNIKENNPRTRKIKNPPDAKTAATRQDKPSKMGLVTSLLTRAQGCTAAEIIKATGWLAVSVPPIARKAGLKLTKKKDGSVTRYYGAPSKKR